MDATNAKGWYSFTLAQAETNADACLFTAKSSTANISIVGSLIFTTPPNFSTFSVDSNGRVDVIKLAGTTNTARDIGASVLLSSGTGAGQLSITTGVVSANTTQVSGTAQTGRDLGASVLLSPGTGTGQLSITAGAVTVGTNNDKTGYGITSAVKKNQALAGFTFIMTDSTTHAPKTGVTVTAQRSLDGAALSACTNSVVEISNGLYKLDLSAADLNANSVDLRFTGTSADDVNITIITQP